LKIFYLIFNFAYFYFVFLSKIFSLTKKDLEKFCGWLKLWESGNFNGCGWL